jgi:hypothetical protein
MGTYAAGTSVGSDASRSEIARTVTRYGADQFAHMESADRAMVAFVYQGRHVRLSLPLPDRRSDEFTAYEDRYGHPKRRTESAAAQLYEQAIRQRWRALALVVKANLEAVEAGIFTFEEAFLGALVLPGGRSVYEEVMPAVAAAIESGGPLRLAIGPSRAGRGA